MLIRNAEIRGRAPLDVRLADGRIAEIQPTLRRLEGEPTLDARGGALLPGLHDHHLHLHALAAALDSVPCGPPAVRDRAALAKALREAGGSGWIRGVGYHESVAGELDRAGLDALRADRPVRVQHRSGTLWILNSLACERLGIGEEKGRLFQRDEWLRDQLGPTQPPRLAVVGQQLLGYGVTGLTDATPANSHAELAAFQRAVESGDLPQHLVVMGKRALPRPTHGQVERGAVKVVLSDAALPSLDELAAEIEGAHEDERPVAVHCVTRVQLVVAVSAFAAAGCADGDRIEHASVAPPDAVALLADLPLTVVTQPNFIRERGDQYRLDVDASDLPWLYRCQGLLQANVPLGGGTDAPYGNPDPWLAIQAAVDRRCESGAPLGSEERLSPERALALFTTPHQAPGGRPRQVAVGQPADLCLLDRPWARARDELSSQLVAATIRNGTLAWHR